MPLRHNPGHAQLDFGEALAEITGVERKVHFFATDLGDIDMINNLPPPTEAEEYRNTAEILRELSAQTRFCKTRNELFICADNLDRMAALAERQSEATLQTVRAN